MLSSIDSIIKEFSSFKVEFSDTHHQNGNPFEKGIGPGVKINSYSSLNEYDKKCKSSFVLAKIEIETYVLNERNKIIAILELEEKQILLRTLVQTFLPEDIDLILIGMDSYIPINHFDELEAGVRDKMFYFVKLSRELIHSLVEFIRQKLKLIKKSLKLQGISQMEIQFPEDSSSKNQVGFKGKFPKLYWNRSDTDLLELIISLYECGCIKSDSGEFTQTMAIQIAEELFNCSIKNPNIKIHKAGARIKKLSPFLEELQVSYGKRLKRLDTEKQKNK
jgi:hypothetical protein